MNKQLQR